MSSCRTSLLDKGWLSFASRILGWCYHCIPPLLHVCIITWKEWCIYYSTWCQQLEIVVVGMPNRNAAWVVVWCMYVIAKQELEEEGTYVHNNDPSRTSHRGTYRYGRQLFVLCQGTVHNWYRCIGSFQNTYAFICILFFTKPYCSDVRHQKWYRCPRYQFKKLAAISLWRMPQRWICPSHVYNNINIHPIYIGRIKFMTRHPLDIHYSSLDK